MNSDSTAPTLDPTARFMMTRALVWTIGSVIVAGLVARVAVWAQHFRSPVVLFPLLVGVALGMLLYGLMRLGECGHRPTLWAGTVLAVVVAAVGQHYICYREDQQREVELQLQREAQLWAKLPGNISPEAFGEMIPRPPVGFAEYMRRQARRGRPLFAGVVIYGQAAWASWIADGLLTLAGATAVMIVVSRRKDIGEGDG